MFLMVAGVDALNGINPSRCTMSARMKLHAATPSANVIVVIVPVVVLVWLLIVLRITSAMRWPLGNLCSL